MSRTTDSTNYSAIQYRESIENQLVNIYAPLKHLGITHAGYFKFFKNGTYLMLCNNLVWNKFFLTQNLADKTSAFAEYMRQMPFLELQFHVWPQSKGSDCLSALYEFNVWNGIDLTTKHEDSIEVYFFATNRENNQIFDLYVNHIDLLIKFTAYFQEKSAHLIHVSDKKILAIQGNKVPFYMDATSLPVLKPSIDINAYVNQTSISRYYLNEKYSNVYFTKREMECLWHLSQGKTSK